MRSVSNKSRKTVSRNASIKEKSLSAEMMINNMSRDSIESRFNIHALPTTKLILKTKNKKQPKKEEKVKA